MKWAFVALWAAGLALANPTNDLRSRDSAFNYDSSKIRGVNLGGWLVLEPWITPSLFVNRPDGIIDEFTLSKTLGRNAALALLQNHWKSWITLADFQAIAAAGLNVVRIPIGYWAVAPIPGEPYVQGQLNMLDTAIQWAAATNLKVIIDLHGAPGSQNGFDNSGRLGPINWLQGNTVDQTIAAVDGLAKRYKSSAGVVIGLEILNEPAGFSLPLDQIKDFYNRAYETVRKSTSDIAVVLHDAFKSPETWNGFATPASGAQRVVVDTHQYQIFSPGEVSRSPAAHVQAACALGSKLASTDKWTIVGEWTGAQTDCAKWLNGVGIGARYDGTYHKQGGSYRVGDCVNKYQGSVAGLGNDDKINLRHFIEAQLDAYEMRSGWIFWNWKTESAPEWNMKDLLANKLFPQPLTQRQYPGQCALARAG